jgi:hypothetical protein
MRNRYEMLVPVCSPPSSMWTSDGTSSMPRGLSAVSRVCLSHGKALRMWKDDGQQYPLFTREGFLRQVMWASPRMWISSLRATVPCRCMCPMYDSLRETAQALVRNRFRHLRDVTFGMTPVRSVLRYSTRAPSLVTLPPPVRKSSRAAQQSSSLVPVDAFNSPCCVGGPSPVQPGARLPLPRAVRTSARLRSATPALQRLSASIPTHTKRTATLRIRTSSCPLPGITESSSSWWRRLLLSMCAFEV